MINADKARVLTKRATNNIIDEQLRYLFEDIEETASEGKCFLKIDLDRIKQGIYDYKFWIEGSRNNSSNWEKVKSIIENQGFDVKYYCIGPNKEYIIISWE